MISYIKSHLKKKFGIGKPPKKRENIVLESPVYHNRHLGNDFLILGTGSSLLRYGDRIKSIIHEKNLIVIGVNNITSFLIPDYHGFTNKFRLRQYGHTINSKALLSIYFSDEIIEKCCDAPNEFVMWQDLDDPEKCCVDDQGIIIHHGTSATLMVLVAYAMGGRRVYLAGIDGFSNYLKTGKEMDLHFHPSAYKKNVKQEELNNKISYWKGVQKVCLDSIALWAQNNNRLQFKHITPCEYMHHFDGSILGIDDE
jgi:hypothetical protein